MLVNKVISEVQSGDEILLQITKTVPCKLDSYKSVVCCDTAPLARLLDAKIAIDLVNDEPFLGKYVPLSIRRAFDHFQVRPRK